MKTQPYKLNMICLNVWGARAGEEKLLSFLKRNDVDVFCFQEMWDDTQTLQQTSASEMDTENVSTDLFSKMTNELSNYKGFFRPHLYDFYGLAIFIKKEFEIIEEGEVYVHKSKGYVLIKENINSRFKKSIFHSRNLQYLTIRIDGKNITFVNFHGLWDGTREDTEDKLIQSKNIINFLKKLDHPYILCGDFNLQPNSKSLAEFENYGLNNLIKKAGVASTRNNLYKGSNKLADYVFTSPEIEAKDLTIIADEISDHAPIYLEFLV